MIIECKFGFYSVEIVYGGMNGTVIVKIPFGYGDGCKGYSSTYEILIEPFGRNTLAVRFSNDYPFRDATVSNATATITAAILNRWQDENK